METNEELPNDLDEWLVEQALLLRELPEEFVTETPPYPGVRAWRGKAERKTGPLEFPTFSTKRIEDVSKMTQADFERTFMETQPFPVRIPEFLREKMLAERAARKDQPMTEYKIPEFKRKE